MVIRAGTVVADDGAVAGCDVAGGRGVVVVAVEPAGASGVFESVGAAGGPAAPVLPLFPLLPPAPPEGGGGVGTIGDTGTSGVLVAMLLMVLSMVVAPVSTALSVGATEAVAIVSLVVSFARPSSVDCATRTPPITATTATDEPMSANRARRPRRAARGNPVRESKRRREFEVVDDDVDEPEPEPVPGPTLAVAARTRSRRPNGRTNAGAAPKSASGARVLRLRSHVAHSSMCRLTRLRTSTVNSPSHAARSRSRSGHSRRPALATA